MTQKVAIVTGANTGIGEVTARELARGGKRVYLACRSEQKGNEAIGRIRGAVPDADLEFLQLDLASLESVKDAAEKFLATGDSLDLLINNAGIAGPRGLTKEGFELTFGVNHLGHFLFTQMLLEKIVESGAARIVNVASKAHYRAVGPNWKAQQEPTKSKTGMFEYQESKLANVLYTKELEKRLKDTDVTTYALHPGVVASDIWSRSWGGKLVDVFSAFFMISVEEGAKTTLHCATDAAAPEQSGLYWDESKVRKPSRLARDEGLANELWERSLEWTSAPSY